MTPPRDFINCAIKRHHPTPEEAQEVIDRWPGDYKGCHVYLCPECREGWLVGHRPKIWQMPMERREEVTA